MREPMYNRIKPLLPSIAIASALFLIQVWTLARSPQSPDGAEMIAVVEQGKGVLHTPGFPLQSWLNQWIGLIPAGSIALRLSVFSLACQTVAVFLMSEILRQLGINIIASIIGLSFYAFFPSVWILAVQPEKYALTALLFALLGWFSLKIALHPSSPSQPKRYAWLGLIFGLGLSQHLIFPISIPFLFIPFFTSRKKLTERAGLLMISATVAGLIATAFYFSLFLRSKNAIWPDWGKLATFSDLVRQVTRRDFPAGQLSPHSGVLKYGALPIFLDDYWNCYLLAGLIPIFGIFLAFTRAKDHLSGVFARSVVAFLALAILFLYLSRIHPPELIAYTFLERYSLPACFALALLSAWALDWLLARAGSRMKPAFLILAFGFPTMLVFAGWTRANLSYDRTLNVYRELLAVGLDDDDIFIQGIDLDIFYGAKNGERVRYPIFGDFPWAIERANYLIDPRLKTFLKKPSGINEISRAAFAAGYTVTSTNRNVVMAASDRIESRGFHWVASPSTQRSVNSRTLDAALKMCQTFQNLNYALPTLGHYYPRVIFEYFRYPFYSAARYLEEIGKKEQHDLALKIAFALYRADDPIGWMEGCRELLKLN